MITRVEIDTRSLIIHTTFVENNGGDIIMSSSGSTSSSSGSHGKAQFVEVEQALIRF